MKKYCLTNTLYESQLESRIEGYKAHIKALESEMDKICEMWDEDRSKLREINK
jgi:chaperonin cofactor prefoldin